METPKNNTLTQTVEKTAAEIPSHVFLCASIATIGASLLFKTVKKNGIAFFLGQWVAPLLLLGIYNKLTRTEGPE
jgi:hypothetical protein